MQTATKKSNSFILNKEIKLLLTKIALFVSHRYCLVTPPPPTRSKYVLAAMVRDYVQHLKLSVELNESY